MPIKIKPNTLFVCLLLLMAVAIVLLLPTIFGNTSPSRQVLILVTSTQCLVFALTLFIWKFINSRLMRPLRSVIRGAEIILKTHATHQIEIIPGHQLGRLPEIIHELGDEIANSGHQISRALMTGAGTADTKKDYLEQVIKGLDEGVIVCDNDARIILYNPSVLRILQTPDLLGLGRSLYNVLSRAPIQHGLEAIHSQARYNGNGKSVDFICSTLNGESMLHCRMGLLNEESTENRSNGFVMTLSDVTLRQGALSNRNELLRKTVEQLRSPLANLRAASENITLHPDMPDTMQTIFNQIISSESENLTTELENLANETRKLLGGELVTADIISSDLINSVAKRQTVAEHLKVTQTGLPLWMRIDNHAMAVLLEFYMREISSLLNITSFDIDADQQMHRVYLDITWKGPPVMNKQLDEWKMQALSDLANQPTVDQILQRHSSVVWSQKHPRIDGHSLLRIPVPSSPRSTESAAEIIPSRPVAYDFNLAEMAGDNIALKNRRLRELNFVVFDTETTGLNPDQGDEIISIGAVRVVNQRILTNEVFDVLVDPNRPIPKSSIRYHGITDEQVKGKPTIDNVLPDFKNFVGNSVLVAHNAWFDLKFLKRREMQSGIRFRNPVLDTLMLSVCLHGHDVDQSLDAIVARFGIEIFERHTALADSLATAELLLRLIDLLETKGIHTLQDALNAYR